MTRVDSYQAKTHLPELLQRVEHGEKIIITRRGTPIALLSQPPQKITGDVNEVVEEMLAYRNRRKRTTGGRGARALIQEGRKF